MLGKILKAGGLFGVLAGAMFVALFFTLIATNTPLSSMLYRADLGLMIFFSYLGIYYFRYYLNYGEMKVWQGVAVGSMLSLISALFISVAVKVYINPERSDVLQKDIDGAIVAINLTDSTGTILYLDKYGETAYNEQIAALKAASPAVVVQDKFSSLAGVGLIFCFIFSILFRNTYDEQT